VGLAVRDSLGQLAALCMTQPYISDPAAVEAFAVRYYSLMWPLYHIYGVCYVYYFLINIYGIMVISINLDYRKYGIGIMVISINLD
jgi:hypothetical protein